MNGFKNHMKDKSGQDKRETLYKNYALEWMVLVKLQMVYNGWVSQRLGTKAMF